MVGLEALRNGVFCMTDATELVEAFAWPRALWSVVSLTPRRG